MRRFILGTSAMAAIVMFATLARAELLSVLIQNQGTIALGDKIWGDFYYQSACQEFGPADITVEATLENGVYYLRFQGPIHASPGEMCDVELRYSVTATAGRIYQIDQTFNLTGGEGTIAIGETVYDQGFYIGKVVAQSTVNFVNGESDPIDPPGEEVQGDSLIIDPALSKLWVTKDILLEARGNSMVGTTVISQSFHQRVPDGGVTALLLGLAFMVMRSGRRLVA